MLPETQPYHALRFPTVLEGGRACRASLGAAVT
jgi:hypothetical protein